MKKRWLKMALAVLMAAITLLGIVGCGKVEMPQGIKEYLCVEHTYGPGEVERWATCIREGRVKHTCTECGHEKYETLTKVNHTPYTVPAREATCAQTGYTEHTACAVCGTVISGKQTTPKTTCLHADDYYVGMGVYACPLCKDERMEHQESTVTVTNFVFDGWYRFYLPKETSKAWISFEAKDPNVPIGSIGINEFYALSIGFDFSDLTAVSGYIGSTADSMNFNSDARIEGGADYLDIYLGDGFYEMYHDDESENGEITLTSATANVTKVVMEGGAKLVRLQGVGANETP